MEFYMEFSFALNQLHAKFCRSSQMGCPTNINLAKAWEIPAPCRWASWNQPKKSIPVPLHWVPELEQNSKGQERWLAKMCECLRSVN